MISYDNLWRTMKEKGVTQYALIKKIQYQSCPNHTLKAK